MKTWNGCTIKWKTRTSIIKCSCFLFCFVSKSGFWYWFFFDDKFEEKNRFTIISPSYEKRNKYPIICLINRYRLICTVSHYKRSGKKWKKNNWILHLSRHLIAGNLIKILLKYTLILLLFIHRIYMRKLVRWMWWNLRRCTYHSIRFQINIFILIDSLT